MDQAPGLQHVPPPDLDDLFARAKYERWTELILLGPRHYIGGDRDHWPEHYQRARQLFKLTETAEDLPARIIPLTSLTLLNLGANSIGPEGTKSIAASLPNLISLSLCGTTVSA